MLNDDTPKWDLNYVTPDWVWGHAPVGHWELVIPTQYGVDSFGRPYTGVIAFPDGRLVINDQEFQCASVEEAKEMGMTTYLLTKEGG